jgi:hypothetical protein
MNTNFKKILIIVIVVLVIALIGLLVYNFLIRPKTVSINNTGGELPSGETVGNNQSGSNESNQSNENLSGAPQEDSRLRLINIEPILAPTISADKTKVVYFLSSNGNILESDFRGATATVVSDVNLENLVKAFWSPNKNKIITIFQDNIGNVSKYLYNLADGKSSPLGKYLSYISWSTDGNKITYQYQNETTGANDISTANPDGSKYSVILNTRMKDLIVEWPTTNIYLREKPSGLAQSSLYSLNPSSRAFSKVMSNIYGFSLKWSLTGNKILYSKTNSVGENISLYIANNNSSNERALDIQTLTEKCVWSQDVRYIFCAIPKNIKEAKVLPDDFYKGIFVGNDEFYKINTETGEKINILGDENLSMNYDANNLFLSPQEDYLFFVNKIDGRLYSIEL